jgi:hypothetical protein
VSTPDAESGGGAVCPVVLHGDPLSDRKSTFQAHTAQVKTIEQVNQLLASNSKVCIKGGGGSIPLYIEPPPTSPSAEIITTLRFDS